MLRTTDMTTTKGGEQFYPTPPSIKAGFYLAEPVNKLQTLSA